MENPQQPQISTSQETAASHSNNNPSLPMLLSVVALVAVVAGGIGYYVGSRQSSQKSLKGDTLVQVSPKVETLPGLTEAVVTTTATQVNSLDECNELTKTWNTANIANALTVKMPTYFKQDASYGGQHFTIDHPIYKKINLDTSLIGDYAPQGAVSVEEKLLSLLDLDTNFGVPVYSINKEKNYRYVIGNWGAIVIKEKEPIQWWKFSIVPQENNSTEAQVYTKSEEMRCILDTVEFSR